MNGQEAYEYINTGTAQSPTWSQIKRLEDVDHPDERDTGEMRTKESDFVKTLIGARKRSIAFRYKYKKGTDAVFTALQTAYNTKAVVHYMALDGPATTNGSKGFEGPFKVTKFSETRPFTNPLEFDVELMHCDADDPDSAGNPWEVTAVTISGL